MSYSVLYTKSPNSRAADCGATITKPFWHQLEAYSDRDRALHRARNHALDNGGYVCVKDDNGKVIFGTDPVSLDRAIMSGINADFTSPSHP